MRTTLNEKHIAGWVLSLVALRDTRGLRGGTKAVADMSTPPVARFGIEQRAPASPWQPHPWFATCAGCPEPTRKTAVGEETRKAPAGRKERQRGAPLEPGTRVSAPTPSEPALPLYVARFDSDSAGLSEQDKDRLRHLLPELKRSLLTVAGYSDDVGPQAYNDHLALQRATAVEEHLIGLGLAPDAILTFGRGKCCYVQPNTSAAGRAANRRAEIRPRDPESMRDTRSVIEQLF
jgi:outer membrane protein OmpA-like peptidoglycan-associated protein